MISVTRPYGPNCADAQDAGNETLKETTVQSAVTGNRLERVEQLSATAAIQEARRSTTPNREGAIHSA
jgi:hypothetical protein